MKNFLNLLLVVVQSLVLFAKKRILNLHIKTYANYNKYIVNNFKLDKLTKQTFKNKLMRCKNWLSKKLKRV